MPSNMIVTLPTDNGETITARLTNQISFSGFSFGSVQLYPLLFNYMFSSYGYSMELTDYREGDWTEWIIKNSDSDDAMIMKKAFLKKFDNGQEWWQVQINHEEEESSYVAEVLFSEDRSSVRRLREKVGDGEVQEKPVSEGWYNRPVELTSESKEGAVKERDISVAVPGGSFTADLLSFGVVSGISLNMWQAPQVPGGVVKYENRSEDEVIYTSELADYGDDAETLLESY